VWVRLSQVNQPASIRTLVNTHAALRRLENVAYPLTILGMLVGVFALGYLLQWSARGLVSDDVASCAPQSVRSTWVGLLLIIAMSAIDLIWTILSGSAGLMNELNPVASDLIHSPLHLLIFKVSATAFGVGLLYVARRRRQPQLATWWVCLVFVLLTFRWAVFNSLLI
jgi:hypothetical protein